jgi:hypothetical protein
VRLAVDNDPSAVDGREHRSGAPEPSIDDALQLERLYVERGSPKFEPAARRWLVRYLAEEPLSIGTSAKLTATLAKCGR